IPHGGDAFRAGHGVLILNAAAKQVQAQEAALGSGDIQIVRNYVLDECTAAHTSLDVEGKRLRTNEPAVRHPDITDPAGGFSSNADAGKDRVRHCAVRDLDILTGLHQSVGFASPSAFDSDAVIAGRDIAAIDADVLAGIDVDAVAVAASGPDRQVANRDV